MQGTDVLGTTELHVVALRLVGMDARVVVSTLFPLRFYFLSAVGRPCFYFVATLL